MYKMNYQYVYNRSAEQEKYINNDNIDRITEPGISMTWRVYTYDFPLNA